MAPNLDDFVWMEILCRLRSTKSILRCKCVSKRWNSLISGQYFTSRFIDHHREKYKSDFDPDQLSFFFNCSARRSYGDAKFVSSWSRDHDGNKRGHILPITNYRVECSFNDLLVCSEKRSLVSPVTESSNTALHIVNPFTKEHVELPMPNLNVNRYNLGLRMGFVCEPFYSRCGSQFSLKANYGYRVVRIMISYLFKGCRVETYSSETREWSLRVDLEEESYFCRSNIVAHNGKLYWFNANGKVVVYDPFVKTDEPCFNFLGLNTTPTTWNFKLTLSQGSLLLMQSSSSHKCRFVSIWKLRKENHGDGEAFIHEHEDMVNNMVCHGAPSFVLQEINVYGVVPRVLGVDPSDQDVIFFGYDDSPNVASYNLETKEWQVVGEMQGDIYLHRGCHYGFGLPVTLPWWPTPVH